MKYPDNFMFYLTVITIMICFTVMIIAAHDRSIKKHEIELQKMRVQSEQIRNIKWNAQSAKRYLERVAKEQPE